MTPINRRISAPIVTSLALSALLTLPASAQVIRPSQAGGVMQWVGATKIDITYHRPVARGRELFGKLVPFDKVWSPSADSAAVFTISTPITVNGSALATGTYTLWAIPGQSEWTLIFSCGRFPGSPSGP
jgi:ABC-type transport system involved in cytochrome c biogenesis permease subunit